MDAVTACRVARTRTYVTLDAWAESQPNLLTVSGPRPYQPCAECGQPLWPDESCFMVTERPGWVCSGHVVPEREQT